jgi:hypothetical protein
MRFGNPLDLTVGGTCNSIIEAIEGDFLAEPRQYRKLGMEVLVTGWTWKRRVRFGIGRPRTFCRVIAHSGRYGEPCKVNSRIRRMWQEDPSPPTRGWNHVTIGVASPPVREQFERMRAWLSRPNSVATAEEIEAFIAAEIRRASAHPLGDVIGTDLMSVYLPALAPPRVRYLRDVNLQRPNLAYSPGYIDTNGLIAYPMQITGPGFRFGDPSWPIEIQSIPPLPDEGLWTASSQPRRPRN